MTSQPKWIVNTLLAVILAVSAWTLREVIDLKVRMASLSQRLEDHINTDKPAIGDYEPVKNSLAKSK